MPQEINFYLFGSPRLEKGGDSINVDTRKAIALLSYLALGEPGQPGDSNRTAAVGYSRESLAALLYPESNQSKARGALRRTLSSLRKALGKGVLQTDRERVAINPGALWVDVLAFHAALAESKMHQHPPDQACLICMRSLQQAADLYRDGFMVGFTLRDSPGFDEWQFFQSQAQSQAFSGVLEKLSSGLAAQGDFDAAIYHARHWLSLDPLREDAHRQLIRLFSWHGQRNAALRQYRECVRILDQELGVPPLDETTQLYQAVLENNLPENSLHQSVQSAQPPSQGHDDLVQPVFITPTGTESYPLVGRDVELQNLLRFYIAVSSKCFFCTLEGEAGIGKTRLAEEFLNQVKAKGAAILQARCFEGETGLAYAPFLDSLNTALSQSDASTMLNDLPPGILRSAAQLIPALADLAPASAPLLAADTPGEQTRFFDALRQVFGVLLKDRDGLPGVLFIDDLQWADAASIGLLAYLSRRLENVFILAVVRSDSASGSPLLRQIAAQAERNGRAASINIHRLQLEDISQLIKTLPGELPKSEDFAETLFRETEGNPFFVVEYIGSLKNNPAGFSIADQGLPPSVRDLLQARLDGLDEVSRQLLSAAAVLGRTFDFPFLRAISGRSEIETISGIETLIQHGLISEENLPSYAPGSQLEPSYDFTHEKLRTLAYEQVSQARRRLLHQRAAESFAGLVRQNKESASLAAYHFRRSGQLALAADYFYQAGEFARSLYANQDAITHFQNALACDYPEPALLHEAIGDLHALQAEYHAALVSYDSAAALCTPQHLPWIEHKLGIIHHQRGEWELAECYFQVALEELGGADAVETGALVLVDWSRTAYRQGDTTRALGLARDALQAAESTGNQDALAQAHNILGILERAEGHTDQAFEHLEQCIQIAENLADPRPLSAAYNNLARVYADTNQVDKAIQLTGQALNLCLQCGDRHRAAALHNNLADLLHASGQQDGAMEHLIKAVTLFAEIDELAVSPGSSTDIEATPEIWKLSEW